MTTSRPDLRIAVVIPSHNGASTIADALIGLQQQSLCAAEFEVVVVDDGSNDETELLVSSLIPTLELNAKIISQAQGGVNAARNAGIQATTAPVIAFIDDDEVPPPSHLTRILALLDQYPEASGAGGPYRQLGDAPGRTCNACSMGSTGTSVFDPRAPHLLGGNMAIRRAVFDELGPFNPALSGRGDEGAWFRLAGRTFVLDPTLWVWHRRDHLGMYELVVKTFHQGRSIPAVEASVGSQYRPDAAKIARPLGHALRHRCWRGVLLAMWELGATTQHVADRARSRFERSDRRQ